MQINKDKIFVQPMGKLNGEAMSKLFPKKDYLDIVMLYRFVEETDGRTMVSRPVFNEMLEDLDLSEEELFEVAEANTKRLFKPMLFKMEDVVRELSGTAKGALDVMNTDQELSSEELFVLTNESRTFGASVILYTDYLREIRERIGADFYIIPSSVHELIIISEKSQMPKRYLKEVVMSVNRDYVNVCDFLSDSIYMYRAEEDEVCIVA